MSAAPTASVYTRMTGGCTAHVASAMLSLLSASHTPLSPSSRALDNACGPAVVTAALRAAHARVPVLAADASPDMLAEVEVRCAAEGWEGVETRRVDAREMDGVADGAFTHAFLNFGLVVPGDQTAAGKILGQMHRVLEEGGVAVVSSWADRVFPTAFYNTVRNFKPDYVPPVSHLGGDPESLTGSWLVSQLERAGFGNNIELHPITTQTSAASFDALVDNMLLARRMFLSDLDDAEFERASPVLAAELRRLRTFAEEADGGEAHIGMRAWVALAWKKPDRGDRAC